MNQSDAVRFFASVLPRQGYFCAAKLETFDGGRYWLNTPHDSIVELANRAAAISAASSDAYMGLATFRDRSRPHDDPKKAALGRTKFFRTHDNAAYLRSLWLDIDVKANKPDAYPTRRAAGEALAAFLERAGLPWPLVVDSGYGFHVYWPLSVDLPYGIWHKAATALKALSIGLGLKADHGCTADASRVLRPVGTYNWKDPSNPKLVRIVSEHEAYGDEDLIQRLLVAAKPYKQLVAPSAPATAPASLGAVDPLLQALGVSSSLPKHAEPIIKGCKQIREAAFQREDVWRGMLSVVRQCERGEEWCHALSALDAARYDADVTTAKLATLDKQQGTGGMPMSCALFNEKRPGVCDRCIHANKFKSPIVLGLEPEMQPLEVKQPPALSNVVAAPPVSHGKFTAPRVIPRVRTELVDRYTDYRFELVGPDDVTEDRPMGIVRIEREEDDAGNEKVKRTYICTQAVFPIAVTFAYDITRAQVFTYYWRIYDTKNGDPIDVPVSGDLLFSPQELLKKMGLHGVVVPLKGNQELFVAYMRAYIDHIRKTKPKIELYEHFGWSSRNDFVLGGRAVVRTKDPATGETTIDGITVPTNPKTADFAHVLTTAGSLEEWQKAYNLYARPGNEHMAFATFTGWGAPLLRYTESEGFLVHMVGESGAGKSTLQTITGAIWGDPKKLMVKAPGSKVGSTRNALMSQIGKLHHLPLMLEEITLLPDEEAFSFVHSLAFGQEKDRMNSAQQVIKGGSWQSIFLSSANKSLREMLLNGADADHEAVLNRMLELQLPSIDENDPQWMADQPTAIKARDNYGHAGEVYAQWLVANQDNFADLVRAKQESLMHRASAKRSERLWFASLAAMFVGAELAHAAGLHIIDVAHVENWVINVLLPQQRAAVKDSRPVSGTILGDILADMMGNTVIVSQSHTPMNPELANEFVVRDATLNGPLKVRFEEKNERAYISRSALREWCKKRRMSFQDALSDMRQHGFLEKESCQTALGRGVPRYSSTGMARVECICVKVTSEMLEENNDDDSSRPA